MRLKLWKKYAFFVAYVRVDQLAKTRQPRLRLERAGTRGQRTQFGMVSENARYRFRIELIPGLPYQPFLLDEVRGHA
jgi:hypothetical protein